MKIILPFNNTEKYPLTQNFGEKFLYHGKLVTHKGIDFAMPKNTQLIAPFDAVIKKTTPDQTVGYGRSVYLEAKDKKNGQIIALLAHMQTIDVEVGWNIKQGQNVGRSGRTGFWRGVNGYHLHFGLKVCGEYIDPLPYIKNQQVNDDMPTLFDNEDEAKVRSAIGPHTVIKGESLWRIAEKYYNNGGHFMEIYRANEDIIEDPNLIYPGQVLRIPILKNKGI